MKFTTILLIVLMQFVFMPVREAFAATLPVNLGNATGFAVLAGSGIINTGTTTITGDVGTYPTTTETGFGTVTINGTNHAGDGITQGAQTDLGSAYTDAVGRTPTTTYSPIHDLGGATLSPGVYNDPSSFGITGTLTLDGGNDPNAVFIFQAGDTLTTETGSSVVLENDAQSCNVFWQVGSSATIKTSSSFVGNILASDSITLNTSATIDGRVLAQTGVVTMDDNTIVKSTCISPTPTPTSAPTATPSPTPTATPTLTPTPTPTSSPTASSAASSLSASGVESVFCPALNIQIISPTILESRRVSPTSIFVSWGPYSGVNTFSIQYGPTDGNWLYSTDVTGFSTTINSLPANVPVWVRVGARSDCTIGIYGQSKLVGGPGLPGTGFAPRKNNISWYLAAVIFVGIMVLTVLIEKKYKADNVTFK
jgi:hypothetical protein